MLAVIHRSVLGLGPKQFHEHFVRATEVLNPEGRTYERRHKLQLETYRKGKYLDLVKNSILGLIDIYNLLPQATVDETTVKGFQHRLQECLREEVRRGNDNWENLYSPRNAIWNNRLYRLNANDGMGSATIATIAPTTNDSAHGCITRWLSFKDSMSKD